MKSDITATDARRKFFEIVKGATEKHLIYRIQHPKGSVVMLSEEEYDSLIETLQLLSIPGFMQSLNRSVHQMNENETYTMDLRVWNQVHKRSIEGREETDTPPKVQAEGYSWSSIEGWSIQILSVILSPEIFMDFLHDLLLESALTRFDLFECNAGHQ